MFASTASLGRFNIDTKWNRIHGTDQQYNNNNDANDKIQMGNWIIPILWLHMSKHTVPLLIDWSMLFFLFPTGLSLAPFLSFTHFNGACIYFALQPLFVMIGMHYSKVFIAFWVFLFIHRTSTNDNRKLKSNGFAIDTIFMNGRVCVFTYSQLCASFRINFHPRRCIQSMHLTVLFA